MQIILRSTVSKTVDSYMARFKTLDLSWEALLQLEDAELVDLFTEDSQTEKERYEALAGYFSFFEKELLKPGCTLAAFHQEYLLRHPEGYRDTQFCWHIRQWNKKSTPGGKLLHKAGDNLYIDFCGDKLSYVDKTTGEQIAVEVFVAALPAANILL